MIAFLVAFAALVPPGHAAPARQCDAARVFAQVRTASGGDRWRDVKEIVADGRIVDSGATGHVHFARDLVDGRSEFRESLEQGKVAYVYDGHTKWEVDQGLGVHAVSAEDSIARAATQAYLDRNGFWSGAPNAARFRCRLNALLDGKAVDVVRVVPRHGNFVDVWVDRSTHLIDGTVEQLPATLSTRHYEDYRDVGGLLLPFRITQRYTDADGAPAIALQVIREYRLLRTVHDSDFRRPPDPTNARIASSSGSARIPFSVDKGVVILSVRVNGRGPFAFTFDPGAQGVVTTVASAPLGLQAGKMAIVSRLQLGDAEVSEIALPVYGGNSTDLFPERDPHMSPIAGSLGPELLDRFSVRLNYAEHTVTLAPPQRFACPRTGVAQRFTLQEDDDIPLVPAIIDGHAGRVQYDVRAPSSLYLFRPFLESTGLSNRYRAGTAVSTLVLGGTTLHSVPARFATVRAGKFASRTEAGLVGSAILSQFVTTLNYRTQEICFEKRSNP